MGLRGFVRNGGLACGMVLIAGAACLACTEGGRGPGGSQGNPLTPPVACTMIGCGDGLTVELRPDSGWPAGEYRFRILADGVEVTCRGSLPLASCLGPGDAGAQRNVTCDTEGLVQIVESGCALPASAHAFPELWFDPKLRPRKVEITITWDGQLVGEADIIPSFQRVYPNGPACPPACDVARALIDVDFSSRSGR